MKIFMGDTLPEGWGIERDVKIASGHGFFAIYNVRQKRANDFFERNFPRRGKLRVPARCPTLGEGDHRKTHKNLLGGNTPQGPRLPWGAKMLDFVAAVC